AKGLGCPRSDLVLYLTSRCWQKIVSVKEQCSLRRSRSPLRALLECLCEVLEPRVLLQQLSWFFYSTVFFFLCVFGAVVHTIPAESLEKFCSARCHHHHCLLSSIHIP
ncbi:unnamed protein product, partial [Discosporangium mesarthrocarpum]